MDRLRLLKVIGLSTRSYSRCSTKSISTVSNNSSQTPWFVDEEFASRAQPPHLEPPSENAQDTPQSLSADIPDHLKQLHSELSKSPHLEPWGVEIRPPLITQPGPPLPHQMPKGRRRRGRTDFGLGVPEPEGGLWRWIVLAQVGTLISLLPENLTQELIRRPIFAGLLGERRYRESRCH